MITSVACHNLDDEDQAKKIVESETENEGDDFFMRFWSTSPLILTDDIAISYFPLNWWR